MIGVGDGKMGAAPVAVSSGTIQEKESAGRRMDVIRGAISVGICAAQCRVSGPIARARACRRARSCASGCLTAPIALDAGRTVRDGRRISANIVRGATVCPTKTPATRCG